MDPFFFVPGSKLDKISAIQALGCRNIIIDLEDAVKFSEQKLIVDKLIANPKLNTFFLRVPLINQESDQIDASIVNLLIDNGYKKFMLPKLKSLKDFEVFLSLTFIEKKSLILLIETPRLFMEAKELLQKYSDFFLGISMGSHDFMALTHGVHTLENLEFPRQTILYLARMAGIMAIDIASMELKNQDLFTQEVLDGFNKGYDAKLLIHPWQLALFNRIEFYSEKEHLWARRIAGELKKVKSAGEFSPMVIDGQVYERPHLEKANRIIRYFETRGNN